MKKGIEFVHSREKRWLDLAIAHGVTPIEAFLGVVVSVDARRHGVAPVTIHQRTGQNQEQFLTTKFSVTDLEGKPLSRLGAAMQHSGWDEVAQIRNIKRGQMSIFGWRPPIGDEFVEFMDYLPGELADRHNKVVLPTRPGIFSSFARDFHAGMFSGGEEQAVARAEMNIQDVERDSLAYEAKFLGETLIMSMRN